MMILGLVLALLPGCAAGEESTDILGKPFPDFTATDTEGNTFRLSEALKDHDAVLVTLWASWCRPCTSEFSRLEEAWQKCSGRAAFIALSGEPKDTLETAAALREQHGLSFPMGIDEGLQLKTYNGREGFPQTVIVDRFSNTGYLQAGIFMNAEEIERLLDYFLDEGYTQTAVLESIPADDFTRAYPVYGERAVYIDNGQVKKIEIGMEGTEKRLSCYVVPDETAHIRLEISAKDNPFTMAYQDLWGSYMFVTDLYNRDRNAFVYDQAVEGESGGKAYHFSFGRLADEANWSNDLDGIPFFLIRDEQYLDEVFEFMASNANITATGWAYTDEQATGNEPKAYTVHVVDQYGQPVPDVAVNFCTDTACVPKASDENGRIIFTGAPAVYHVQLVEVLDGYSYDEDFELCTGSSYGEWVLRVRKD